LGAQRVSAERWVTVESRSPILRPATGIHKTPRQSWLPSCKRARTSRGCFAQNDEEAIGAIQAIQEAGLVPGKDIMVVGIDASKDGFAALIAGTLGADIETNPLIAPQVYAAALKGMNGDVTMPSFIPSQEGEFFASQGADALKAILLTRQY